MLFPSYQLRGGNAPGVVGQIIVKVTASTKIRSATAVVRKATFHATCKEKQGNKAGNTVREKKRKEMEEKFKETG